MQSLESAKSLLAEVKIMRRLQKSFFRTKDRTTLSQSKESERIVDKKLEDWFSPQTDMFK